MRIWKSWAFATFVITAFTFLGTSARADHHGHSGGHHGQLGGHHDVHHGSFGHHGHHGYHGGFQVLRPAVPTYSPGLYGYGGGYYRGGNAYQAPLQQSYRVIQPRVRHHRWHPGHYLLHH